MDELNVNSSIREAHTLPTTIYTDPEWQERQKENVFARSWQWIGDRNSLLSEVNVHPFSFMKGFIEEPLMLTKADDNKIRCLSNVCTHRGNLLADKPKKCRSLVCGYHGRKFSLSGRFESMPEFNEAVNFPTAEDNLPVLPIENLWNLLFTSLDPAFDFSEISGPIKDRLGYLPLQDLKYLPGKDRTYQVKANWALYCDNYLEGFHIPFVHPDLNTSLDYQNYEVITFPWLNLQIGIADKKTESFDLPTEHPDHGKRVAAYYFWIFPNLMLNFYPWGLSVNVVRPMGIDRSEVDYYTYMLDESKIDQSAGALLDKVEKEDEEIVEKVQLGVQSRFYKKGRFSPSKEQGVHHFHLIMARALGSQ